MPPEREKPGWAPGRGRWLWAWGAGTWGGTPAESGSPHVADGPDTSNCGDGIRGAGLSEEADYTDLDIAGIYYKELGGFGD